MKFVLDEESKNALVAYRIKHAKDTFAEVRIQILNNISTF